MIGNRLARRRWRSNFRIGSLPAGVGIALQASASPSALCLQLIAPLPSWSLGAFGSGSYISDPPHARREESLFCCQNYNMREGVGGGSETSQVGVAAEKGAEIILTWLPYPLGGGDGVRENRSQRCSCREQVPYKMSACWGQKPSLGLTHCEETVFVPLGSF